MLAASTRPPANSARTIRSLKRDFVIGHSRGASTAAPAVEVVLGLAPTVEPGPIGAADLNVIQAEADPFVAAPVVPKRRDRRADQLAGPDILGDHNLLQLRIHDAWPRFRPRADKHSVWHVIAAVLLLATGSKRRAAACQEGPVLTLAGTIFVVDFFENGFSQSRESRVTLGGFVEQDRTLVDRLAAGGPRSGREQVGKRQDTDRGSQTGHWLSSIFGIVKRIVGFPVLKVGDQNAPDVFPCCIAGIG